MKEEHNKSDFYINAKRGKILIFKTYRKKNI